MSKTICHCFLALLSAFISIPAGTAYAQASADFGNARQLDRQEILDLIANKKITYRITVGGRVSDVANQDRMQITFKKTEEFGGDLSAFSTKSSSTGKWHVNENARLVRQYERVSWGNKPFTVAVVQKDGKYFWKLGEEFQELLSIE